MNQVKIRPLFNKYQKELVKFFNTDFGRDFLYDISGAFKGEKGLIVKVSPESIHVLRDFDKQGRPVIEAVVIIKPKILFALKDALLKMELEDKKWGKRSTREVKVPHLFGYFKGVDLSKVIPIGLTTTTFNPAAGNVSGYDGVTNTTDFTATTFATARAMNGVGSDAVGATIYVQILENGGIFRMQRAITLFDTSSLTALATINSATYELYPTTITDNFSGGDSIAIALPNPASTSTIAATDYNIASWTMIAQATAKTLASLVLNEYNTWTFNATGLSNISKTGISKFGFVSQFDLSNTDPGDPGAGSLGTQFIVDSSDGTNDPKLNITYTLPESGFLVTFF